MLKIQRSYVTWHGMSRRSEETEREYPIRRRPKTRHKIPRSNRDRQQKTFEWKLWTLISRQRT
eukprot:7506605-Prorocentrum_lima.AAC.1